MNTLRIAYRLTKKRKGSLFLLTVEIIICSIVILSTLGKIFYYFETKDLAYSFDGKNIYYFSPYTYYDDFSAEELLSQKGFKNVGGKVNLFYAERTILFVDVKRIL